MNNYTLKKETMHAAMNNIILYNILGYAYLLCTVLYLVHILFKHNGAGKAATVLCWCACGVHAGAFLLRWAESYQMGIGHLPIRGPYECITFSAGVIIVLYLLIERILRTRAFGGIMLPVVALMMIYAAMTSGIDSAIQPMPEVLQGNYINYHLASCFVGYGAFTVSCAASIVIVVLGIRSRVRTGDSQTVFLSPDLMDAVNYRMIAIGFIMFSILIITGMFRSKIIWGRYWEWDPVQTWSFLSWIVYAAILHGRYVRKWHAEVTAVLSIIGFAFAVMSFLIGAGFVDVSQHFPITG